MTDRTNVYQLKVTLRDISPRVWRRFRIRGDVTLASLHRILQLVMGWTDSHLHEFVARGQRYGKPDRESLVRRHDEKKVRLEELLSRPKDRMVYEYDFGDGWEHEIVLEKVLSPEPGAKYPYVVAGKRACPPEDCGGVPGYYHMLEVLSDPAHAEHQELLEWSGGGFDPDAFSVSGKNAAFHGGWYLPAGTSKSRLERTRAGRAARARQGFGRARR